MLLTIDIGTSTFKFAVWNHEGQRLSFFSVPLIINTDDKFKFEANPSLWLDAFEECCRKTENLNNIDAIVISGNGPSLVPVLGEVSVKNKLNVPSKDARLWLDRRAINYQDKVSEIMGGFVDAKFFLPKIIYIKNEQMELYKKTLFFLGCPEYLAYALTGQARTVFPCEGFDRWFWDDSVLKKLDLDSGKFPQFIIPGDIFGKILTPAAEQFGFKKNIPVIAGGPDFYAAILGSGVIQPGQVCNRTGTSDGINFCALNNFNNKHLMSYRHPVKPYWNLSGIINISGKLIEKGFNTLGLLSYDEFFEIAATNKNSIDSYNYANFLLKNICLTIKTIISVMEESGENVEQLRVTGGLAGYSVFNQLKADITGKEVIEGEYKESELLGLAIIGSCSLGLYPSIKEACTVLVKTKRIYEPN
ncbi:MAG: FGGY-family carbohydrate kinase [Treponema sp.]|nr:FGGY-family carbohydrate kinase [Treponema sp.]